jgi:Zn finger protein HypA/HybF involved in hydrogenase expression
MLTCKRCRGWYSGRTRDGFCPACEALDSRWVYSDPTTLPAWLARHTLRLNSAQNIHATRGACPNCKRAIDDHKLTVSKEPYATAQCPT